MVNMLKGLLRRIRDVAAASALPFLLARPGNPSLTILMYHRVLPVGHPELESLQPGMYVTPETLDMHIRMLRKQGFVIVHLDDWIKARAEGKPLPPRAAAITLDDGWRDNYEHAFPVLRRANAPAMIFLVSDMVGTKGQFWPEMLVRWLISDGTAEGRVPGWLLQEVADATGNRGLPLSLAQANEVVERCKRHPDDEMNQICSGLEGGTDYSGSLQRQVLDWDEIREMGNSGLVRFGSHTKTHTRLRSIADNVLLADEIRGSRESIERAIGLPAGIFCYPNGEYSDAAIDVVRGAYAAAVTTRRGICRRGSDRFLLPRVGMHEDASRTRQAFLARIAIAAIRSR
jgi:peptidoglycan/xylan/chitin deacetylase (PgdA/CDA1 family)